MSKSIVDKLTKRFDDSSILKFREINPFENPEGWVHSGSADLDHNLGTLGFRGLVEISGLSKSGKTTLALEAMKHFQKKNPDGVSIILSSEERDNMLYAEQIGVDTERVLVIKSKFIEDLFFKLQETIDETEKMWKDEELGGKPKLFVFWDSVGATNSRAEVETFKKNVKINRSNIEKGTKVDLKNAKMGDFAKVANQCMKGMLGQIYTLDMTFILLNHLKDRFDSPGKYTPGGRWLEFLPNCRLQMTRKEWIKIGEDGKDIEVGQITIVKTDKNDFGSRKPTEIEILLGYGIVLNQNDINFAVEEGLLKKEGEKKYTFMGKMTWNSKRTFYQLYYDKHKFLQILHSKIRSARHEQVLKSKELNNVD